MGNEICSSLELVLNLHCHIGESPIWDQDSSTLTFIDQTPGRVFRFDPAAKKLSSFEVGREIGAAIPRQGGGFVLTSHTGLLQVNGDEGPATLMLAIDEHNTDTRLNDAKCDRKGRLWTGTFSKTFQRKTSALYCVGADLELITVATEVSISNGIAWSPDGSLMYFVDTAERGVDVFDFDLSRGMISNRRRFVDIARSEGVPDGITVDCEGNLWVALYLGGQLRRYSQDGRHTGSIQMPVVGVTSCAFGGPDLKDLYITTAVHIAGRRERPRSPFDGGLYLCRSPVAGLPEPKFPR
jgi:sugar lactone lactonase YvrE